MRRIVLLQRCASVNFRKWRSMPDVVFLAVVIVVFLGWNFSGVVEYSLVSGMRIAPWVFPFLFSMPIMLLIYGYLTIVFFARAPFRDSFSQFMEIRTGKRLWIEGQLLYILEASGVYCFYYFLVSFLMILPRIDFTMQWGPFIEQLAYNSMAPYLQGVSISGISFYNTVVETCSPVQATGLSFLLLYLVTCLIGTLIFFLHIVMKPGAGMAAAGFLVFFSYFINYVGGMMLGSWCVYVSPVNWICLGYLDLQGSGQSPEVLYAVMMLLFGNILLGGLGVRIYCLKDMR